MTRLTRLLWLYGIGGAALGLTAMGAGIDLTNQPSSAAWDLRLAEAGRQLRTLQSPVAPPTLPQRSRAYYVSPDGSNTHPGTREQPFASLEAARDAIRRLKGTGGIPGEGVTVIVRGGRYPVSRAFQLASQDSGTASGPIVYRAADGESPVFTGGARLHNFQPVADSDVLDRLPSEARSAARTIDLAAHGITNVWSLELGGFSSGRGFRTHRVMELFFNGNPLPLARGPNEGWLTVEDVLENHATEAPTPSETKPARFITAANQLSRWHGEPDLWLYGYWYWDWADSYERVAQVDPAQRTVTLDPPLHTYGFRAGQRFYAVNALSELDQPGEWHLDAARGRIVFWPPSDPDQARVELSVADTRFVETQDTSHVWFEGLTWELGCRDAVMIRGGRDVRLAGCTARRFAGNAVEIQGGLAHVLLSCDLHSLGRGGIILAGGNRQTLQPSGHRVENCHVYDLSRIDHTYTPAVHCSGVGHHITRNWFHDVRSSALRVDGNDHLVDLNDIGRVVLESDDQGAVDMWGDATYRGNVYRHNLFHHVGSRWATGQDARLGQAGIRLDDAISGTLIYGNVFLRVGGGGHGFGAVQIHGGKENLLWNNLIVDSPTAVSFSPWNHQRWLDFVRNALQSSSIDRTLYLQKYPALAALELDPNVNWIASNLVLHCREFLRHAPAVTQTLGNIVTDSVPGFTVDPQHGLVCPPDAPAWHALGLEPIPLNSIGLQTNAYRRSVPRNIISQVRATGSSPLPDLALMEIGLFDRRNLAAWCIVPFDSQRRGPEERAAMLERLGIRWLAYDYRAEHIPTFDAELEALKRHGIGLLAWWFPGELNDEARLILDTLQRHQLQTQLWVTGAGDPVHTPEEHETRVRSEAQRLRPIVEAAAKIGCTVGLYNHGGWFGEPENQVAVIEHLQTLGSTNVGIVYNQHHGHDHLDRFAELMTLMKPHLLAFNLNGMTRHGDRRDQKILPLGQGDLDLALLRTLHQSGWRGPVGILNHTDVDAEARLSDNLDGLNWLVRQLEGGKPAPRPVPTTWEPPAPTSTPSTAPSAGARSRSSRPDYWAVEDAAERAKLPLYRTIAPPATAALTPADRHPPIETFRTWHRSHGDNGGRRYSGLNQINTSNVHLLQSAWTYHSGDGAGNIQCNPIVAKGTIFAPTPGRAVVAVNAATGVEQWRFHPDGRPAFRGLIYCPGDASKPPRLLFCAGPFLYALDPSNGQLLAGFGEAGRVILPGRAQGDFGAATAGPAVFEHTVVVPGFEKDAWAFDIITGAHLWTFHTVPQAGEFGADTWDQPQDYSANCWGGMAMDDRRGIAYLTTGSPKPNFIGVTHHGLNLYANCLIALDVRTGQRLWHFQEVRHDIWDLDIPAPPNLATIVRDGHRVDVVAAVTKIGNTLLLDRVTGDPVFPFRLRRAPASDLPGEQTWPHQPYPELPETFSPHQFTEADLTRRTEETEEYAASRFQSMHHGWFRPCTEGRPNAYFGIDGGAEWTGACVDPTGRLYVTANHMGWVISVFRDEDPPDDPHAPRTRGQTVFEQTCATCHGTNRLGIGMYPPLRGLRHRLADTDVQRQIRDGKNAMPSHPDMTETDLVALLDFLMLRDRPLPSPGPRPERPVYNSNGYPKFYDHEGYPANQPPWGTLTCIDLNTGRRLWQVPLGEYPELTELGVPLTGTENYGGAIVTAGGLVFCAGTRDHRIRAFDRDTGKELWAAQLPWVGSAPPASYEVDGRQFVVIPATGGNKLGTPYGDAYVAFALPPL